MATLNGHRLLTARIPEPRIGPWHASVTIDHDAELTGTATIDLDGVEWVGTVLPDRSGVHGGHVSVRVVGGAGGLSKELGAKDYTAIKASAVLADILREAGETLSGTVDASFTAGTLAHWQRSAGPASHALVALLDALGGTWRVLRDGTIWVGRATYPEATPGSYVLRDEDWSAGSILISPDAPLLEPGTTFREQKIEQVETVWQSNRLSVEAFVHSPRSSLERFLGSIRRRIDYSRSYPAKVVKQNADGTLQLVPDDPVVKGSGLDKVPIRLGVPGSVKVSNGQRVLLGFAAGDPERPFAICWERDSVDELALGAATEFVALADKVVAALNTVRNAFNSHTHTGVTTGVGSSGPPPVPMPSPGSVAATKVKAE